MLTNLDFVNKSVITDEKNIRAKNYLKYCEKYDLDPKWLFGYFETADNRIFQLKGLVKNGSKMFIVIQYLNEEHESFYPVFLLTKTRFIGETI